MKGVTLAASDQKMDKCPGSRAAGFSKGDNKKNLIYEKVEHIIQSECNTTAADKSVMREGI